MKPQPRAVRPAVAHLIDGLARLVQPAVGVYVTACQSVPFSLGFMRALLVIIAVVALTQGRISGAGAPDTTFLLAFLAGDYRMIGQQPDSGASYAGRVSFRERGGKFDVTRVIAGVSTQGTASVETVGEGTAVLRSRFTVGGVDYEATYLWRSDLDNYPRLTGHIYRAQGKTESPGLEALFHVPPSPEK